LLVWRNGNGATSGGEEWDVCRGVTEGGEDLSPRRAPTHRCGLLFTTLRFPRKLTRGNAVNKLEWGAQSGDRTDATRKRIAHLLVATGGKEELHACGARVRNRISDCGESGGASRWPEVVLHDPFAHRVELIHGCSTK
jgi:hypothetical protein